MTEKILRVNLTTGEISDEPVPESWQRLGGRALVARFLLDPVFYFYMFWIPQYLHQQRGSSLEEIGRLAWAPFLTLGISNVAGGWLSDLLVRRGGLAE